MHYFEDLVNTGSLLERIMAGLSLFMIWCSLRFTDAIRTDPHMWQVDGEVIMGACKSKTKSMKEMDHSKLCPGRDGLALPLVQENPLFGA